MIVLYVSFFLLVTDDEIAICVSEVERKIFRDEYVNKEKVIVEPVEIESNIVEMTVVDEVARDLQSLLSKYSAETLGCVTVQYSNVNKFVERAYVDDFGMCDPYLMRCIASLLMNETLPCGIICFSPLTVSLHTNLLKLPRIKSVNYVSDYRQLVKGVMCELRRFVSISPAYEVILDLRKAFVNFNVVMYESGVLSTVNDKFYYAIVRQLNMLMMDLSKYSRFVIADDNFISMYDRHMWFLITVIGLFVTDNVYGIDSQLLYDYALKMGVKWFGCSGFPLRIRSLFSVLKSSTHLSSRIMLYDTYKEFFKYCYNHLLAFDRIYWAEIMIATNFSARVDIADLLITYSQYTVSAVKYKCFNGVKILYPVYTDESRTKLLKFRNAFTVRKLGIKY